MKSNGIYVYQIISEEEKTAKFGNADTKTNCNGFVEGIETSGKITIPDYIDGYRIIALDNHSEKSDIATEKCGIATEKRGKATSKCGIAPSKAA